MHFILHNNRIIPLTLPAGSCPCSYLLYYLGGETVDQHSDNENLQNTRKRLNAWELLHGFERCLPYGLFRGGPRPQTETIWQVRQATANSQTFQMSFDLCTKSPPPLFFIFLFCQAFEETLEVLSVISAFWSLMLPRLKSSPSFINF